MIKLIDLQKQHRELQTEIESAVLDVLRSGHYILGPNVSAFETEAAAFLGAKYTVGCANGSDALYLALLALGIKAGDEVITTAFTYIATAGAISQIGAIPVFADIDPHSFNIDPDSILSRITTKTRAIIVVHLYGQCADMTRIMAIAKQHGLYVIEDAAQAFGAAMLYQGQKHRAGTIADIGTFSFYPTKNLSCAGDGGLMATNSDELNERLRKIRVHGTYKRYHHDCLGVNSRLDEIQAAILRIKLKHIDNWNLYRRSIAKIYNTTLAELTGLKPPQEEQFSAIVQGHVYHQYTIRVEASIRDTLRQELLTRGIETEVYYPLALQQQKVYLEYSSQELPEAELAARSIVCLPISADLELDEAKLLAEVLASVFTAQKL